MRPKPSMIVAAFLSIAFLLGGASIGIAADSLVSERLEIVGAAKSDNIQQVATLLSAGADVNAHSGDGVTALHWAARNDNLALLNLLLEAGATPSSTSLYGATPLFFAAQNGSVDAAASLLDAGADPNTISISGETVLMTAVRTGRPDVIRLLLERGALVGKKETEFQQTALMLAVRENQEEAVRILLRNGATLNDRTRLGPTPVFYPPCKGTGCGSEGVGINRSGVPDRGERHAAKGGMTALLYAAREGHTGVARMLVAAGADIEIAEANGITPLLMALLNNQLAVAHLLLDHGARINVEDFWGRTPLFAAVDYRNLDMNSEIQDSPVDNGVDREPVLDMIRRLLAAGADVDARTREWPPEKKWLYALNDVSWVDFTGQTAFIRAALSGDITVMRLLLEYGADPGITTYGGTTALMAAAGVNWTVAQTYTESEQSLLAAVRLCLELGGEVNAINSMGLTALMGAANRGSNDIIEVLVEHGASLDMKDEVGRDAERWAEGVFLAAVGAVRKADTVELLQRLKAPEVGTKSAENKRSGKNERAAP